MHGGVVIAVYRQVLEHDPNGGVAVPWIEQLTSSQRTVREVMQGLASSAEHRQRFLPKATTPIDGRRSRTCIATFWTGSRTPMDCRAT